MIAYLLTTAVFAVVPWALALPVMAWRPQLQKRGAKRVHLLATAAWSAGLTALFPLTSGMTWLLAIGAALWLDVYWLYFSRTVRGRAQLASAKAWRKREDETEKQIEAQRYATPKEGW